MYLRNFHKKRLINGIVIGGLISLSGREFINSTNNFLATYKTLNEPTHTEKATVRQIERQRNELIPTQKGRIFIFERCFNRSLCILLNEKKYKNHNYMIMIT